MLHKLLTISLFFAYTISAAQCAMCKAVVENGNSEFAEGLNDGIVTLMIIPYILVAIVGIALWYFYKRNK